MAETTETAETPVSAILARAADLLETTTIDPKTVLAKAADIIEEDGWQQGRC